MDKKKGIELLDSKSEFNRWSLSILRAGNHREIAKEIREEEHKDKVDS